MLVGKFYTLTASLPIALSSGLTYTFSVWSDVIRERYGLSQEQLQGIGSAANLGGCVCGRCRCGGGGVRQPTHAAR